MGFTHIGAGIIGDHASSTANITLAPAINPGDLLAVVLVAGALPGMSDSAGAVSTWHVVVIDAANNAYMAYGVAASAAAGGTMVTATGTGGGTIHFMAADIFRPSGTVTAGGSATTGSSGVPGLNLNSAGLGDLGTVPGGALAYGAFWSGNTAGDQAYTPGFQSGMTPPADVIGAQLAGANGTGVSLYVLSCAASDVTLTWFGTGTAQLGRGSSMYFTTTTLAIGDDDVPWHLRSRRM